MAGDPEYKTNFFLRFNNEFTYRRFIEAKSIRYARLVRYWLMTLCLIWTLSYFTLCPYGLVILFLGYIALGIAYLKYRRSPYIARAALFFIEHFIQLTLGQNYELSTYLVTFNIATFISDILLLYEWRKHAMISFSHIVANFLWGHYHGLRTYLHIFIIAVSTTIFACIERTIKEGWVLFDSFKKSSMTLMGVLDASPYAMLLIDPNGRVFFKNSTAADLLENYSKAEGKAFTNNFIEMIHPRYREEFRSEVKSACKELDCKTMEVPIKLNRSDKKSSKDRDMSLILEYQGLRSEGILLITQIGYELYLLKIKRHYWKNQNALLIKGIKITKQKTREEVLLQHQMLTCSLAEKLWSTFS